MFVLQYIQENIMANPLGVVASVSRSTFRQATSDYLKKLDNLLKAGQFHKVANRYLG